MLFLIFIMIIFFCLYPKTLLILPVLAVAVVLIEVWKDYKRKKHYKDLGF